MKKIAQLFILTISVFLFIQCQTATENNNTTDQTASEDLGKVQGQANVADEESAKNVLQVAIGSESHQTLVAAVKAADLENVLVNAGPLTVFAPTDEAFDALPTGTLDDLLLPESKSKLAQIIKYHASPGNYDMDMLKDGTRLYQASGHYVKIKKEGGETYIKDAKIMGTVPASNGIVHVIDKVILPPEE